MNKKIFKSIFFASLCVLFLSLGTVLLIMHNTILANERHRIEGLAQYMAENINKLGEDIVLNEPFYQYRITLIDLEGKVLFDSQVDVNSLGNHLDRQEFKDAISHGSAYSSRVSHSLDKQLLYYAIKLQNDHVLRLSIQVDTLFTVFYKLSYLFLGLLVVLSLLAVIIARHVSNVIIKPLNDFDINRPLANEIYDEIKPFVNKIVKQQEQIDGQLRELERKSNEFLVITKSMSEGLILINKDGIIISMNKMAQKIFQVGDDCIGMSFLAIDRSEYFKEFFIDKKKLNKKHLEITKYNHDYQMHFNQIQVEGNIKGYAVLIIDVTEKNRAQRQRQEFTANVSHELKTPIQSIIGYSELIENGIVQNGDIPSFASKIRLQATRLVTLIEDIIFLSRLDEGQSAMYESISMYKICHEIFESLSHKAQKRNVKLELEGNDIQFRAVYRYIYEAIYNLCDNGIKYNHDNGFVKVILKEQDKKIVIVVKDSGIGIPKEHQERIFERFYRVDKSHSRQTGGTGLGLSIVKRVVLFHRGKIKLRSGDDGSEFTITLNRNKLEELIKKSEGTNK